MGPIMIAIIIVLCQYPVALLTLMKMFRCKLEKNSTIIWNIVIVLIPFLGAAAFWIYYLSARKMIKKNIEKYTKSEPLLIENKEDKEVAVDVPEEEAPKAVEEEGDSY